MGTIHRLLEQHGKHGALQFLHEDHDRRMLDAAAQYMADEDGGIGFIFSGWAQAALPHRRLENHAVWQLDTQRVTLLVEPGRRAVAGGEPQWIGVPFGSRAPQVSPHFFRKDFNKINVSGDRLLCISAEAPAPIDFKEW